jgi:hypothetical protein
LIAIKQSTRPPTTPPAGCASYLVSPPSSPRVFGWLLCFFSSFGGCRGICHHRQGCRCPRGTRRRHLCPPRCCHHSPLMSLHGCAAFPFPLRHAHVFLVGCRVKKIERLVGDVAVLAVPIVIIFVALVVAIALPKRSRTVVWPIPSPLRHARLFLVGC